MGRGDEGGRLPRGFVNSRSQVCIPTPAPLARHGTVWYIERSLATQGACPGEVRGTDRGEEVVAGRGSVGRGPGAGCVRTERGSTPGGACDAGAVFAGSGVGPGGEQSRCSPPGGSQ